MTTVNGGVSHWFSRIPEPRPGLPGDREADVCIVGAGYTGLWTSYYLRQLDPGLNIALLEARFAGFGASGRNGGWLSGLAPGHRGILAKRHGRDSVIAWQRMLNSSVDEVIAVAAREGIDAHSATIENLDKNIGRILRWLDSSGQAENTLLIMILGDNGMSNFMFRGEKGSEYEAGHRVPCLVRWPKHGFGGSIASSRDIPNLTSEIDWLPTLMSLLELRDVPDRSADTDIHGISLVPLLEPTSTSAGGAFKDRVLIVDNQRLDYLRKFKQACVMKDESSTDGRISHKWRLIRNSSDKPWELYDVEGDRWEAQNLLLTATDRRTSNLVRDLQASYESWWSRVSAKADDYVSPVAGTSSDPEICLLAHDWHTDAEVPWNQTKIAAGMRTNGFNAVTFFKAGEYVFDLRRWPREIEGETTIASGLRTPIRVFASNALTYGRPLAVRSARIRIWCDHTTYVDARQNVDPREVNSVFKVILPAGPAFIQTWFYDASGSELCGAYYDYVSLKEKVP